MSDIDTAVVDSLKVLDLKWPIREADIAGFWREMARSRMTQDGHSGEAAGQLHDFANAGGVEIIDAPGEPDDAFGRSRLKSCR